MRLGTKMPLLSQRSRFERRIVETLDDGAVFDPIRTQCPRCGSTNLRDWGTSSCGRARYMCYGCGRTFSSSYGTPFYRGRLDTRGVKEIIRGMSESETIRGSAKRIKVSKTTALRWRHLLLKCLSKCFKKPVLKGKVFIDESMLRLSGSLLGKRKLRGVSNQQTSIGVAVDGGGHIDARVLGVGHVTAEELREGWGDALDSASLLIHDDLSSYSAALSKGIRELVVKSRSRRALEILNPINRACSMLQWFLAKHRGITKKHLQGYLDLFVYTTNQDWEDCDIFAKRFLRNLMSGEKSLAAYNT